MPIKAMFMQGWEEAAASPTKPHTPAKAPSSPVEPRSVEELLALVDSLTSAQKALAERSSTGYPGGVPLDRVAGLVAQMIEDRRRARQELQQLC